MNEDRDIYLITELDTAPIIVLIMCTATKSFTND